MSAAAPFRQQARKRPYTPSKITADDLRRFGIPPESMDRSRELATGRVPGAIRVADIQPARPTPSPKPPAKLTGRPDLWQTVQLHKANGLVKATRVMAIPGGVLVNTSTRGLTGMSEATVFVPGVKTTDFV